MKRILLALIAAAVIASATSPAMAHGRYPRGWRVGFYGGYAPAYNPHRGGYYRPRRVFYPAAPVYPVYRVVPRPRARTGFSYFGPGFSFSVGR